MRGSIYYQTSLLAKLVFKQNSKKINRKNKNNEEYNLVASFKTMETYRKIWNNFGNYIYDIYGFKNYEKIESKHIKKYMNEKIAQGVSHLYLQKISAAMGKLEFALKRFSTTYIRSSIYDFSIRLGIVKNAKDEQLTHNNYRDRAYQSPEQIIQLLKGVYKIAAEIQLSGGTRAKGVCLIKKDQLMGIKIDPITQKEYGYIWTKEKGGKEGEVRINLDTYAKLDTYIIMAGEFRIEYRKYIAAILNACRILNIKGEGTHGFRWSFAQNRMLEYTKAGYSYHDSLQLISYEMKHERPDITTRYTG